MAYIFKGRLCGYVCPECPEALSNVKVRLYSTRKEQKVTALAVANPKETFAILTEEMVNAKEQYLIAETTTQDNGSFAFVLGEAQRYSGEPFEVDVYCETVPHRKQGRRPTTPLQFSITTLQPMWRQTEDGYIAIWEYCLPNRFWCLVRTKFDAWTICGRVTDCNTKAPVMGVRVRAFDADWIQDDPLGEAITDVNGKFRIDYLTEDFQVTPFTPLINIEWVSGPDLYFRIETPGGTPLLVEPRSQGRAPGRENAGHCFCLDLCLEKTPPPPPTVIPLFTHVGMYRVDPIFGDFTADGLTTAGNYAFTDTIPLRGLVPNGNDPNEIEYRFLVGEYDAAGVVLGPVSHVDASKIAPTVIGQLEYFDWNALLGIWVLRSADYWVNNPGAAPITIHRPVAGNLTVVLNLTVDPDGWIKVPRQQSLAPEGEGLFVGGFGNMVSLDTIKYTTEYFDLTVPAPALAAGASVPLAKRSRMHRFKLFFEARIVGLVPLLSSNALDKIVLSNTRYKQLRHPNWVGGETIPPHPRAVVLVDIAELVGPGAGCNDVNDHVHALYTAYHPFNGNVSVYIEGPGPLPASISPAIVDGEAVSPAGGHDFNIAAAPNCAYILWLRVTLNLTHGWGRISDNDGGRIWDHIAFCKG